jgi:spore coat protein CotF
MGNQVHLQKTKILNIYCMNKNFEDLDDKVPKPHTPKLSPITLPLGYKPRRATMIQHLLEYQIALIGKTMVDTYNDDKWYSKWTITAEQKRQFRSYSIKIIKKVFRCNSKRADETFEWFYSVFGLKIRG